MEIRATKKATFLHKEQLRIWTKTEDSYCFQSLDHKYNCYATNDRSINDVIAGILMGYMSSLS